MRLCNFKTRDLILKYSLSATQEPRVLFHGESSGVNCEIVKSGENGFLAASAQEWWQYLGQLITNPQLRARVGGAARRYVEQNYSLESWFPAWLNWIAHGDPG